MQVDSKSRTEINNFRCRSVDQKSFRAWRYGRSQQPGTKSRISHADKLVLGRSLKCDLHTIIKLQPQKASAKMNCLSGKSITDRKAFADQLDRMLTRSAR